MSLVSIPYTFVANTKALASQVNANNAAIQAVLNGALSDVNFATDADLDANKFSSSPGKRVANAKMETNAVDARVLANDTGSPGSDSLRAVSGDHIKTLTVAHVARILPASCITNSMLIGPLASLLTNNSIASEKLKLTLHAVAFSGTPLSAASVGSFAANPSSTFAVASYDLIGLFVKNPTYTNVVACPTATDTTNWGATIRWANPTASSGAAGGTLVFAFLSKT